MVSIMVLVILEISCNRMQKKNWPMFMPQTINQTNSNMADIAFNLCLFGALFLLFGWMDTPTKVAWWLFFKILYGQYYFLDIGRTNINDVQLFRFFGNHGQGTHSSKMFSNSLAENIPNTPKFIRPICPIGKKLQDKFEKRLHRASSVRECI